MRRLWVIAIVLIVAVAGGLVLGFPSTSSSSQSATGSVAVAWQNQVTPANGTLTYRASSATYFNQNLHVVSPIGSNSRDCYLADLNGTGSIKWQYTITDQGGKCRAQDIATPRVTTLRGHPVVAVTMKRSFYLFNATTGHVRFHRTLSPMGFTKPLIVHSPRPLILTAMMKGAIYAFHPNGSLAWRRHLHSIATGEQPQLINQRSSEPAQIVVGGSNSIANFYPNGTVSWRRNISARFLRAGRVHGRPVIVTASEYHVTGLYANGTTAWTIHTNGSMTVGAVGPPRPGTPPLAYVTDDNGTVLGVSLSNGSVRWRHSLHDYRRYVPPAALGKLTLNSQRQVVVGTVNGHVHILNASTGGPLSTYSRNVSLWTRPTIVHANDTHARILLTYKDGDVVAMNYTAS